MTTQQQEQSPNAKPYTHNIGSSKWDEEAQNASWPMYKDNMDLIVDVPYCPRCGHAFKNRIPFFFTPKALEDTTITVTCHCQGTHEGQAPAGATKRGCGAVFSEILVKVTSTKEQ